MQEISTEMMTHLNNLTVAGLFFITSSLLTLVLWDAGLNLDRAASASVIAATFGLYAVDKHQAARMGYRIPEATLHCAALIGDASGAALGQKDFRHKTRKLSFGVMFLAIATAHAIALTAY